MKNSIKNFLVLTSFIAISLLAPTPTLAWDDCPEGKVNDPYPGDCARYIDTDGNGICDHSEPAPEDRVGNIEKTVDKTVESINDAEFETSSNEKEATFSKPLLAIVIVAINLAAILLYVNYKKPKSQQI